MKLYVDLGKYGVKGLNPIVLQHSLLSLVSFLSIPVFWPSLSWRPVIDNKLCVSWKTKSIEKNRKKKQNSGIPMILMVTFLVLERQHELKFEVTQHTSSVELSIFLLSAVWGDF